MQTDVKKVFYYNTSAHSLGGFLENPYTLIASQGSSSVASVGGAESTRSQQFNHEKVVSCHSTYTHAHGRHAKRNGPWLTRAVSVVKNLNILDGVITADLAVSRLYIEHPEQPGQSRLSFAGSHFLNLKVQGNPIKVTMHTGLLPNFREVAEDELYDEQSILTTDTSWPKLWDVAHEQAGKLRDGVPPWVKDRYGWVNGQTPAEPAYAICSVIDKLEGGPAGQTFGHVIELPEFGRFFFGEVVVQRRSVQLTMVRAEMGCETAGNMSAASAKGNGLPYPP
jgi:hypothetical protein